MPSAGRVAGKGEGEGAAPGWPTGPTRARTPDPTLTEGPGLGLGDGVEGRLRAV